MAVAEPIFRYGTKEHEVYQRLRDKWRGTGIPLREIIEDVLEAADIEGTHNSRIEELEKRVRELQEAGNKLERIKNVLR